MAYNKRTWLGRQGTGLNKFSIGGATPVTIVNQPDSVTQVGDALSAGNLNDLEDRIEDAFDDVDTALDTKADEQDVTNLNNALTALDHRVQNLEQAKGDYVVSNYKDGAITPSGKGAWAIVEGLRGVSRVENNLNDDGDFYGVGYTTVTDTDYNHGCKATVASGRAYCQINKVFNLYAGRTYLLIFDIATNDSFGTGTQIAVNSSTIQRNYFTPVKGRNYVMWTQALDCSSWTQFQIYFADENGHDIEITNVTLCDLNIYFNGTIPSDADTIAKIQQNYPHLLTPSEYGTRIVDWTGNGVRAWARNLWDEQWEVGSINNSTGQNESATSTWRGVNYISVTPNVTYYFKSSGLSLRFYWYDADKNFISSNTIIDSELTAPSNAWYLRIRDVTAGGPTYNNNVCVNKSDSQNGTYTPYHAPNTLSLSFTGKSAGSVRDTLELNVEVDGVARKRETERIASVDLGSLTWNYEDATQRFYAILSDAKKASATGNTVLIGAIQPLPYKRLFTDSEHGYEYMIANIANEDDAFWFYTNVSNQTSIQIKDTTYNSVGSASDPSSFLGHLQGKYLNYELAEEVVTLSDPLIDNTLLTESGGRMATVQTGTVVDGSFDMGFITL